MKHQTSALSVLTAIVITAFSAGGGKAQTSIHVYEQMSRAERGVFVSAQAKKIAKEISGRDYEFTPEFEQDILKAVNNYANRLDRSAKRDLRGALERGRTHAPTLMAAFRSRNLSPLMGLYIPFIESEYVNVESPNSSGAIGMFQFLPKTGERYGLTGQDLLDVAKSADAAAHYITESLETFKNDPMKEAVALLAYNRGAQKTLRDLKILLTDQNRQCSICALNADRSKLDETYQFENVFYVPRFFAAAIIGENPQAFGLKNQPLSSN
jgi:membrane-bound lytic murein transglycosylase D